MGIVFPVFLCSKLSPNLRKQKWLVPYMYWSSNSRELKRLNTISCSLSIRITSLFTAKLSCQYFALRAKGICHDPDWSRETYAHNCIDFVVRSILHVVGEHFTHLLEIKLSCAAESYEELISHPWIFSSILEINLKPIFKCSENNDLLVV